MSMNELAERVKVLERDMKIYQELEKKYREAEGILLSLTINHAAFKSLRYDDLCKECAELRKQLSTYKEEDNV